MAMLFGYSLRMSVPWGRCWSVRPVNLPPSDLKERSFVKICENSFLKAHKKGRGEGEEKPNETNIY